MKRSATPAAPSLSNSQSQAGAALILVVLVTLLVILTLLAVVSHVAMASLSSTTAQKIVLPIQLATKSGVGQGQALLTTGSKLLNVSNYQPNTWRYGELKRLLLQLCTGAAGNLPRKPDFFDGWQQSFDLAGHRLQGIKVCDLQHLSSKQTELFTQLIPYEGNYQAIYQAAGITDNERAQFYSKLFSGHESYSSSYNNGIGNSRIKQQAGLIPLALVQSNVQAYDIYFQVAPIITTVNQGQAKRQVVLEDRGELRKLHLTFDLQDERIEQNLSNPSFANFGTFFNKTTIGNLERVVNYNSKTSFSGPTHTNGYWHLAPNSQGNSIKVDGQLTSASCANFASAANSLNYYDNGCDFVGRAGIYNFAGKLIRQRQIAKMGKAKSKFWRYDKSATIYDRYGANDTYINLSKSSPEPNFAAEFVRMPLDDRLQRASAIAGGIYFANSVAEIEIKQVDDYQHIVVRPCGYNSIPDCYDRASTTVQLRYNSSRTMEIKQNDIWQRAAKDYSLRSLTGWKVAKASDKHIKPFNGVLYVSGKVSSLHGPARGKYNRAKKVKPALAEHSQLSVIASDSITITGDLLYQKRCQDVRKMLCYRKNGAGRFASRNMLGIYSSKGDVLLANEINSLRQSFDPQRPNAPVNLELDAFIMAASGTFRPTSLQKNGRNKGRVYVRGGVVRHSNSISKLGRSGWRETVMYDRRGLQQAPPAFPSHYGTLLQEKRINNSNVSNTALVKNINMTLLFVDAPNKQLGLEQRADKILQPTGSLILR